MSTQALRVWTLRREAAAVALAGFVVLGPLLLPSTRSFVAALTVWGFVSALLWYRVGEGIASGGAGKAAVTWPSFITLFRAWLIALTAGATFLPGAVAAYGYTLAAVLDDLDGRLARRFGRTSLLGAKLDMDVDALGILVASAAGVFLGKLPFWYLAIGLARYVYVVLLSVRSRLRPLDPNELRRWLAGVQMGFLATSLWPQVPSWLSLGAAYAFGGATLAMFVRDYRYQTCDSRS